MGGRGVSTRKTADNVGMDAHKDRMLPNKISMNTEEVGTHPDEIGKHPDKPGRHPDRPSTNPDKVGRHTDEIGNHPNKASLHGIKVGSDTDKLRMALGFVGTRAGKIAAAVTGRRTIRSLHSTILISLADLLVFLYA